MEDKGGKPRFFQEIFLVADIKFEVILGMLFLKISNTDMVFDEEILMWKFYTINKTLSTTKQVQPVNPKEFIITLFYADSKTFVVYVAI